MAGAEIRSSSSKERKPPKELKELAVIPGENGGHVIEHRFTNYEHAPEMHPFGESEGPEALMHIAQHANIDTGKLDLEHESEPEHGTENVAPAK